MVFRRFVRGPGNALPLNREKTLPEFKAPSFRESCSCLCAWGPCHGSVEQIIDIADLTRFRKVYNFPCVGGRHFQMAMTWLSACN